MPQQRTGLFLPSLQQQVWDKQGRAHSQLWMEPRDEFHCSLPSRVPELTHRQTGAAFQSDLSRFRESWLQRKAWRQVSHAKQEIKNQVKNQGNPSWSYFPTSPGLERLDSAELSSTPSFATTSPHSHLFLQGLKTSPKAQPKELSFIFCKKLEVVSGEQTGRMRRPRGLSQVKITLWFFLWHFPSQGYPKQTPSSSWKLA